MTYALVCSLALLRPPTKSTRPGSPNHPASPSCPNRPASDSPPPNWPNLPAPNRPCPIPIPLRASAPDGSLWLAAPRGVMLLSPGAERWRLFHSRRWLPEGDVADLALSPDGNVLVKTSTGIGRLVQRETTLDQKMLDIDAILQAHHIERGYVGGIQLQEPGNLAAGHEQHSNDNDGLWTSIYVAAEAFRYGTTGEPAARERPPLAPSPAVPGARQRHPRLRRPQHRAHRRGAPNVPRRVASLGR